VVVEYGPRFARELAVEVYPETSVAGSTGARLVNRFRL
jgi:hypothetical protein